MKKKVTIQDIADALGVSRNTVSKAINNSEGLAEATREKILQKAVEMGYKHFSYVSSMNDFVFQNNSGINPGSIDTGDIALFVTAYIPYSHFASILLDRIHDEISQIGFTLTTYRVSEENIRTMTLPKTFAAERTKGIICIEIFSAEYSDLICSQNIPVLFIDGPCRTGMRPVNADLLMMENLSEIVRAVKIMADRGIRRIGFIGDYNHCESFWERYCAYGIALSFAGLPFEEKYVVRYEDKSIEGLADALDNLEEMPEMFICVNDFVAIDAMQLLAQRDRKLLKKIRFLGFDDSHESRIFFPPLSTIHVHTQAMALSAIHLLLTRMKEPSQEFRTIYVATDLILRDSTEF